MIHAGDFFVRFYLPIITGVLTIVLIWLIRDVGSEGFPELCIDIPFTPIKMTLPVPRSIKRVWIARSAACAVGVLLISWGANADFSRFFPPHLRMDVYYDVKGIQRVLNDFNEKELRLMEISPNWHACESGYETEAKRTLASAWAKVDPRFIDDTIGMSRNNTHGRGTTSFVVERVGLLAYRIVESRGELIQAVDVPGREVRPFTTVFELRESPANHLRPEIGQLLLRPSIIIQPEYKQVLSSDPHRDLSVPFNHVTLSMTRVTLLPFPDFGNTVYLWTSPCGGNVPIGYAIYY